MNDHDTDAGEDRAVRLLDPDEVQAILRVSSRTLRRYAACGKLVPRRLSSRTWRYAETDVRRLIGGDVP